MKKKYSIGLTVHNFESAETLTLLKCLLESSIEIDFIIYHQNYFKRTLLRFVKTILNKDDQTKKELLKKIKSVKVYNISNINSQKCDRIFKLMEPALVICNTGIISQKTINNNPNTYLINVHGSKLPEYRGVSNLYWALWDKKDIWVTVHRINNGIDEGDILYQELLIKNDENLPARLFDLNTLLNLALPKAINRYLNGEATFEKQEYIGDLTKRYYSMHPILVNIVNERMKK